MVIFMYKLKEHQRTKGLSDTDQSVLVTSDDLSHLDRNTVCLYDICFSFLQLGSGRNWTAYVTYNSCIPHHQEQLQCPQTVSLLATLYSTIDANAVRARPECLLQTC